MDFSCWNAPQDFRLQRNRYASLFRFASHDSFVAWQRVPAGLAGFSGNVQKLCAWLPDALIAHIAGSRCSPDHSNGRLWSEHGILRSCRDVRRRKPALLHLGHGNDLAGLQGLSPGTANSKLPNADYGYP